VKGAVRKPSKGTVKGTVRRRPLRTVKKRGKDTRFKAGNKAAVGHGRPSGSALRVALLARMTPEQWAAAVVRQVRKGSIRAMEIYAERIEGKALSEMELLDIEEIITMRANLRAQAEATGPRLVKQGEGNAKTVTALE
jgi:hypothetical protein